MKKLISYALLLLLLAAAFMTDSPPPGWYQQSIPIGNRLITDIYFLDSLTGWVVTDAGSGGQDSGSVYKTTDGGNNWLLQFRSYAKFYGVQFLDANTGYAAGDLGPGVMYKTINGGLNWSTIFNAGDGLRDLFFVNKDTGWAADPGGAFGVGIIKTYNGGINWFEQMSGNSFPQKLFFINKDTGWAGSSDWKLYRTTNGGNNWGLQYTFTSGPTDLQFVSKDTGWVTGGVTGILKSTNGGFSWFSQANPGTVVGESKMFFLNNRRGWIGIFSNRMLATIDGENWGHQWTPAFTNFTVHFPDSLHGWAGTNILIHTTEGGGPITYTGIKPSSTFVTAFELKQNYPNPFNPSTTIEFYVQKPSRISLKIYTIEGKEAGELLDYEKFDAGYTYYAEFNSGNLSSGVYLYQMTGWTLDRKEIFIDTKKMIVIK